MSNNVVPNMIKTLIKDAENRRDKAEREAGYAFQKELKDIQKMCDHSSFENDSWPHGSCGDYWKCKICDFLGDGHK